MSEACYVYAIVGRDAPLPATGSGGVELATVPWRELAAVTRRMDGVAPLTTDAVLQHEAIVEAVRRLGPALPVRFGTVFRDATSVASALAERYEPLAADLDRLGDKVELSLTALWAALPDDLASPPATSREVAVPDEHGVGARYLYARAAKHRRQDTLKERARAAARELEQALGGLALERRVSLLPTMSVVIRAAYLLDPAGVDAFRTAFEAVRQTKRDLRFLLTGPWPPYTFVRQTEREDAEGGLTALAHLVNDTMQGRLG